MIAWRLSAQTAAGNEDDAAKPMWVGEIPWCDEQCPHRIMVACRLTGANSSVCTPVVKQMAMLLSAGPVKP
jgi:hypothetical protein